MIFVSGGVMLALFLVGSPVERDTAILIATVALSADMISSRLGKVGRKTDAG